MLYLGFSEVINTEMKTDSYEEFEAWWESEGQFCRSGGGDYEKSFALAAWQASPGKRAFKPFSREAIIRMARASGMDAYVTLPAVNALGKSVPIKWLERFSEKVSVALGFSVTEQEQSNVNPKEDLS